MDLYEAVETICKDYCKYPDIESGNRLADICDKCPMNKCEELRWADRKTENSSEKPNNCDTCRYGKDKHRYAHICNECGVGINNYTPQTETQAETQNSNLTFEKRTMRDCYNCKFYETEGECIECHFEPTDEPQTERESE